jgi:dihydroflavonol-4-reductase
MQKFLVTGGNGYLGSWLIVSLLRRGFAVRATVRDERQQAALRQAIAKQAAPDGLHLVTADLLHNDGWDAATAGVDGIFHVASPMAGDDVITPAREGTRRVLEAAVRNGVARVVLTSSAEAAKATGTARLDMDESVWTDVNGEETRPYTKAKTLAERDAWNFAAAHPGLELTTILPGFMLGPVPRQAMFPSVAMIQQMLAGALPAVPRLFFPIVDVRDIAELQMLAMSNPEAGGQRLIGAGDTLSMLEMATVLRAHPGAHATNVPTQELPDAVVRQAAATNDFLREMLPDLGIRRTFSAGKAQRLLGWHPRSAEETLNATVDSLLSLELAAPPALTQTESVPA